MLVSGAAAALCGWTMDKNLTALRASELHVSLLSYERPTSVASAIADCRTRSAEPALLSDIVVTLLAASVRSDAVRAHVATWLRGIRALIASDQPMRFANTSLHRFVVLRGQPSCLGSEMYSTALVLANATWPDASWMVFLEDDTVFNRKRSSNYSASNRTDAPSPH